MKALAESYEQLKALKTEVWAVSTDTEQTHAAWLKEIGNLPFPLLSDRNGELSEEFECLDNGDSQRCTVILDDCGQVKHYSLTDGSIGRNIPEIVRLVGALQAVDASENCVACATWHPGKDLIDTTAGE